MKIFFYGGTFDPPHKGHKMIIKKMLPYCDKFIVFPAKKSPSKKYKPIANSKHRMNMLNLLFCNKKIEINDYEINSNNKSYTYLTILYLKKRYKECSLSMVIGKDQLKDLPNWKNYDSFINKINIICFNRIVNNKSIILDLNQYKNIKFIDDFDFDISSEEIRKKIKSKNNKILLNVVDLKIVDYIQSNNLYV